VFPVQYGLRTARQKIRILPSADLLSTRALQDCTYHMNELGGWPSAVVALNLTNPEKLQLKLLKPLLHFLAGALQLQSSSSSSDVLVCSHLRPLKDRGHLTTSGCMMIAKGVLTSTARGNCQMSVVRIESTCRGSSSEVFASVPPSRSAVPCQILSGQGRETRALIQLIAPCRVEGYGVWSWNKSRFR
jgi:hypothetical protein